MTTSQKAQVQTQFGVSAEAYAISDIHAKGESLAALLELVKPQPTWKVLDIATGAGHTALTFAPHVHRVIATDLTEAMLTKTAELATQRGLSNLEIKLADAESLPFDPASFHLVTCRLAFHHFPNPTHAITEIVRVMKPNGMLGFTDNITVSDKLAEEYYNTYEKLRDPSHHWVHPAPRLQSMFEQAGLKIEATRRLRKEFEFHDWADRQHVSPADKEKLLKMMRHIPLELEALFAPRWTDDTMYFSLWEMVIVARKGA